MLMPVERNPKSLWKAAIQCIVKTIRHRKDRTVDHFVPNPATVKYYEENFKMLHRRLRKKGETGNDAFYDKIIFLNRIEDLYLWVTHVQSVIEKEAKVPEKKKGGFFGLFGNRNKAEEVKVVEESYVELFKEIENTPLPQNSLLPKDYVKVFFRVRLGNGVFKLTDSASGEAGLVFSYKGLSTKASFKVEGFQAQLSMEDLSLVSEKDNKVIIQKVSQEQYLWLMNFEAKPDDNLSWSLENTFESLEVNYSLSFMQTLFSFFLVPKTQESAKIVAWDTLKGIQDTTQGALTDLLDGDTQYSIKINCSAPRIHIPSPTQQGFFTVNLGEIQIKNSPNEDFYENFEVSISSICMIYSSNTEPARPVVPNFEIASSLKVLKNKFKYKPKNKLPELILESKLPDLKVVWNASVYHQLVRLPEVFDFQTETTNKDSEVILEGTLKKLTPGLHAWKEFPSKLIGSYLYFGSTSYFYIKDCSILDASEEYQQENTLKLKNIYGECVLSFPTKAVKEQWTQTLNERINEYESRTSLATSLALKKNSSRVIYKFSFEIFTAQVQITDERQGLLTSFQLSRIVSSMQAKEYDFSFSGTLGQMSVVEESKSEFRELFRSLDQKEMIKIEIRHVDSKSKNYKNKGLAVEITGGNVEINWNFELMTEIMNFFQFAEYSDPTRMIEETLGVVDKDHILLDLTIKSESLTLSLVNHKNELAIAQVKVSAFNSEILIQSEGYRIEGTLDKLEISDLTNYPRTALREPVTPFHLFSVRDGGELLRFSIMIYSENYKNRDLDVSSKLEVELGRVDIFYLHQPVMRIVDYLNYHVLGVFDTQGRARKIDSKSIIKPKIVAEKLGFTSISVKIHEPVVHIPPRPGYTMELSINLGVITVKNRLNKAMNPGWEDIYSIDMRNMLVFSVDQQISEQFELSLEITRKILMSEYLNRKDFDRAYLIWGGSKGIKLALSQRDYNLMLKTSDLNLLYDDQLESYISPTYKYTPPSPDEFMKVDFSIPSISILLTYNSYSVLDLLCISTHIHFTKFNDYTNLFTFSSSNVLGLISENSVTSKNQDLRSMAKMVFSLSPESLKAFSAFLPNTQPFILFGPTKEPQKNLLELTLRTDTKSNKLIEIEIACIRINFHLSLFYQILNYCVSGIPNYAAATDTPQDYLTRYRPQLAGLASYCAPQIKANIVLSDSFICLPSTSKNRSLVAQSDLNFVYLREREGTLGATHTKRLILKDLSIFQPKNEEFQTDSKRKLIEPLQFIYEVKDFAEETRESYIIGSLNCALSYKDLSSVQSTFKYQEEMMAKDESIINLLLGFDNLQVVEDRMKRSEDEHLSKASPKKRVTVYNFAGLSVILINDALTAYTPILDCSLKIGDNALRKEELDGKSCFSGGLLVGSSYYNPVADVWEPFIEPFFIETEFVSCKTENIQNHYVFTVGDVLNVNFSEVMVKNLQEIFQIWDTDSSQCLDVISPFQIKNEVGYTVMVEYKHSKDPSIIESGNSEDYVIDYYSREKNSWKSESIRVSIFPGDFAPPKLKLKTDKVQCYSCVTGKQILVVDIELKSTRKIITIRSPLIVENQTQFSILIHFIKTGKVEKREISPKQSLPVPYDLITGVCNFEILSSRSKSNTNLEELWAKNQNSSVEISVGSFFLCLYYKISKVSSNKRTLFIKPPVSIKNCLPLDLGIRLYRGHPSKFEEIEIKKQQTMETYVYSNKIEIFASVSIEGYARSNLVPLVSFDQSHFKLVDRKREEISIQIFRKAEGNLFVAFYVSQIIINNSLNPLAFYHKQKSSEKLFPGQDFVNTILACNNTKKLIIGLGNQRSKAFLTDSVGIKDIIELIGDANPAGHSFKYQYTLDVQMSKILENAMVFCKVIVISPRFLIVNNSGTDIVVAQDGYCEYPVLLTPSARLPFHWAHKDGKELVRFKAKPEIWAWSGAFSIDNLGSFTVQCKNKKGVSDFLLLKVEVRIVDTIAHVIFEPEQIQSATYKLVNDSQWFSLAVYQKDFPQDTRFVNSSSVCVFTWSDHLSPHELIINFLFGKSALQNTDTYSMYILNLDVLNQVLKIKIKNAPTDFDVLYLSVTNEGPSRVVKFSDVPTLRLKDKTDVILAYFNVSVPKLGVSVIEHSKNKSKELFYLTFTKVILLAQNTEKEMKAELMIQSFQTDNQMSPDCIFPVMVHPADSTVRNILHMCFVVNKENSVNCVSFETFEFLLLTLHLRLDTHCVRKLIEMTDRLFLQEQSGDLEQTLTQYKDLTTFTETISVTKFFYFSFFKIHPIKIITTYAPLKYEGGKKDLLSGIASFGMALSSIEEAPIKLYPVQLNNAFASEKRIKDSLKSHYKSQLINEFYSLIGHSNILGNPIGLLNDLGTGVVDFFYEPAQGMVNGPISATEGLIKGTGSLIKNTVSGTFGTVSKITSGITTGLAALTQDSDYIAERQKSLAKHKPSNVVTGFGLGVFSFFKNVGQGITGIVTEPIKGYKKDKMEGMVKGGLKGLGGLVVKPVAGVFDMVSRSAEGIKNTASYNEVLEVNKERYPRVMYGHLRLLQVYSEDDSVLLQHLFRIKKYKYYEKEFLEQVAGVNSEEKQVIVALFVDLCMLIARQDGKIKWKVFYKDLQKLEMRGSELFICVTKRKKAVWYKINFKLEQQNRELLAKIEKLR